MLLTMILMMKTRNRQRQTAISQTNRISTKTELDKDHSLDTNIVCMFTDATADCPNIIKRVKNQIENNLAGVSYSKYANFPSCSGAVVNTEHDIMRIMMTHSLIAESDWGERYWDNYSQLKTMKTYWDPANVFNHCHSVGSTDNTCCPDYQVINVIL